MSLSLFWLSKKSSSTLTSPSWSQLDVSNPRAAGPALCGGLFTYFHNGQIRRVQCSMKHLRFQLVRAWELIQYWVLCLWAGSVWLGSRRTGADNSFISVLILLSVQSLSSLCCQGWSCKTIWQRSFCLIQWKTCCCCCCCCSQGHGSPNSLKPPTGDYYLIRLFYTCSLGVCLCNKNNHIDNLFCRHSPLWSSFYSPSWFTFVHFNYSPICSSIPCYSATLAEPWPNQNPCIQERHHNTHEIYKCNRNML